MSRLSSWVAGVVEWTGVRLQCLLRFWWELCWFGAGGWCGALHGEEAWLGARRCQDWLACCCDGWQLWSGWLVEMRAPWGGCAVRLSIAEVVCGFHVEAVGPGRPGHWSSWWRRRGGSGVLVRGGLFVFCKTARFWAVSPSICLSVTSETEVWRPIHIERHCCWLFVVWGEVRWGGEDWLMQWRRIELMYEKILEIVGWLFLYGNFNSVEECCVVWFMS